MALSKQITPSSTLLKFARWAQAQGYRVGEYHGFGSVAPQVHTKGSWHNDKDAKTGFGLAADINYGVNGPAERAKLIVAMHYARSLGLAVIFAYTGTTGVANNHRNHLHVDVGEWSNIGKGLIRAKKVPLPKGVVVPGVTGAAKPVSKPSKPAAGGVPRLKLGDKNKNVGKVQARLNRDYPAYSKLAVDNIYGAKSVAVVKEFQRRAGLTVDGIAGPATFKKLGL